MIKVGVIGYGYWGPNIVRNLTDIKEAKVSAICDINTDVLKNITLECSDFEIETELLVKASRKGFKVASVDIQTIYRNEVSKIRPVRDTLRFIRYVAGAMVNK